MIKSKKLKIGQFFTTSAPKRYDIKHLSLGNPVYVTDNIVDVEGSLHAYLG